MLHEYTRKNTIEAFFKCDEKGEDATIAVRQTVVSPRRLNPVSPLYVEERATKSTDGFHPIIHKVFRQAFDPLYGTQPVIVEVVVNVVRNPWGDRARYVENICIVQDEGELAEGAWKTKALISALKTPL